MVLQGARRAIRGLKRHLGLGARTGPGQGAMTVRLGHSGGRGYLTQLHGNRLQERLDYLARRVETKNDPLAINCLALYLGRLDDRQSAQRALDLLQRRQPDPPGSLIALDATVLLADCLVRVGNADKAIAVLDQHVRRDGLSPDIAVAMANAVGAARPGDVAGRLEWIGKAFSASGLEPLILQPGARDLTLDTIDCPCPPRHARADDPLISVVIPAYNAEAHLGTALRGLLAQTWTNTEILVVDDCSTDATAAIVRLMAENDARIRLVSNATSLGCHGSRNVGIGIAVGEFIAFHDADDWSHPRKLEVQAELLLKDSATVAVIPSWLRMDSALRGVLRGYVRNYLVQHNSSIMYRRGPVMEKAGYLDPVMAGADMEFVSRLQILFGNGVRELDGPPVAIGRLHDANLTTAGPFGFRQFSDSLVRREYRDSFTHFHESRRSSPEQLYTPFPLPKRLFPAPSHLVSRAGRGKTQHYDVISACYLSFPAGSSLSIAEEVRAQSALGLRTGLLHIEGGHGQKLFDNRPDLVDQLRELVQDGHADRIVPAGPISCDLLIIRYPPVLRFRALEFEGLEAGDVRIVVNQGLRNPGSPDEVFYDLATCRANARALFGDVIRWHPNSPVIRAQLARENLPELDPEDWVNIIDVDAWKVERRPLAGRRPVIGRHSRDHVSKWPADRDALLAAYPEAGPFDVAVLGGDATPTALLGRRPTGWQVIPFGAVNPRAFLAGVDIYVYFHHPNWTEAFGRALMEAMASGAPVITEPYLETLFGDAALYCTPSEVEAVVARLVTDPDAYAAQAARAEAWLRRSCGHERHAARLRAILKTERLAPTA